MPDETPDSTPVPFKDFRITPIEVDPKLILEDLDFERDTLAYIEQALSLLTAPRPKAQGRSYVLYVAWFTRFVYHPDLPRKTEFNQLTVICPYEAVLDGMECGTVIELRLKGEDVGAGLPCVFLSYKPDLWNRPVGTTFPYSTTWPFDDELPELKPFVSVSIPKRKKHAVQRAFINNILNDRFFTVRGNFRGGCEPERY